MKAHPNQGDERSEMPGLVAWDIPCTDTKAGGWPLDAGNCEICIIFVLT